MSSEFVSIGGIRIKRSNISTFGVVEGRRESTLANTSFWRFVAAAFVNSQGGKRVQVKFNYLFVKTYQNDSYQFAEDEINIPAVLADLEKRK